MNKIYQGNIRNVEKNTQTHVAKLHIMWSLTMVINKVRLHVSKPGSTSISHSYMMMNSLVTMIINIKRTTIRGDTNRRIVYQQPTCFSMLSVMTSFCVVLQTPIFNNLQLNCYKMNTVICCVKNDLSSSSALELVLVDWDWTSSDSVDDPIWL